MNLFHTRADMERQLEWAFENRYHRKDVVLTGILLARPEDKLTREQILPNLKYWHHRSDNYTDFFCAGYAPTYYVPEAQSVGIKIDNLEWGFDNEAFVELVAGIEKDTGWNYTGGPCLILLNAYSNGTVARFDLFRSIRIDLLEAIENKTILNPTQLAEIVFHFAKEMNDNTEDPIWEISDKFGRRVLKRGFMEALLAALPSWLSPTAKHGMQFIIHELRARDA